MSSRKHVSRRAFLGSAAAGLGLGFATPLILSENVFGANEKIVTGHIGVGGRGLGDMGPFRKQIGAVCDVDKKHLETALKRALRESKGVKTYGDFRKLLEQKDIDAVVIATPDHWHALQTVRACEAGKDVYVEKPMTLMIAEGRKMVKAARRYSRIVQCGSQQRSSSRFRIACELVRSGRIGKVKTVEVGIAPVNWKPPPVPDSDPPPGLDYNMWIGPAPMRPYNTKRVHYLFRFILDYSGGQMTNWGAHYNDIAQWGLGMDNSGPVEVEGEAKFHPKGWYEVPMYFKCTYKYADGTKMITAMKQDIGTRFIGTKGEIFVNRRRLTSKPDGLHKVPLKAGDVHLYDSKNHHQNWLDCIKSRKLPVCDVEIGHRSATVCHLGNVAIRSQSKVRWDPAKEQVIGNPAAARMIDKPYRAPWRL